MAYKCATCGQTHDDLPDLGFKWPDPYFGVPEAERATRVWGSTDTCAIDDEAFYIRGVIHIPIRNTTDHFGLGVWVSQKRENFHTYLANYDSADIGPFFGWLSNNVPFYAPDTWALKTMAHFQGNKKRPLIELEPSDHPLYLDYSHGITLDRAWSIAHARSQPSVAEQPHAAIGSL
jgi:hypothetical protein